MDMFNSSLCIYIWRWWNCPFLKIASLYVEIAQFLCSQYRSFIMQTYAINTAFLEMLGKSNVLYTVGFFYQTSESIQKYIYSDRGILVRDYEIWRGSTSVSEPEL